MMLDDAAEWLAGQCRDHLSTPVTYRTKAGASIPLRAVIGSTVYQTEDGSGMFVRTETRDFIVSANELAEEPSRGDSIVWKDTVYEVLAPDGSPCWRWSDGFHRMKRIHTKEAGTSLEEEK